jgi:hypothetical protein
MKIEECDAKCKRMFFASLSPSASVHLRSEYRVIPGYTEALADSEAKNNRSYRKKGDFGIADFETGCL